MRYKGSYFGDAGLSYEYGFNSNKLSLEVSVSLGWGSSKFNEVYLGLSKSALNVAGGSLSLTYYPINFLYIRPHVELSSIVDGDLRNQVDDPTTLNFGMAVGVEH
jgi:outer membrane scaffolding protein for murein synthesis (MipA/OmpV family)